MTVRGRILFYNTQNGTGKLITEEGEKLAFGAEVWDDFETMPEAGAVVECTVENGRLEGLRTAGEEPPPSAAKSPEPVSRGGREPTFSIEETLEGYFQPVLFLIGDPPVVVNTREQLDYFRVRRFLMTAYNDLRGLDPSLHRNPEIQEKIKEIQELHKAYVNIRDKVNQKKLAFEMIFLRSQPEYLRFIRHKEQCLSRISVLNKMEESIFPDIRAKEQELQAVPPEDRARRKSVEQELKKLRTHYVDAIHENAELAEELSTMEDLKSDYTDRFFEPFVRALEKQAQVHLRDLEKILNYRAYALDRAIWQYAAASRSIREFFQSANIRGDYSTLTFLRYYLNTVDNEKAGEEQKELFKLLKYLETRER